MCLFIESIRIIDGKAMLVDLHEQRMQTARKAFWKLEDPLSLEKLLDGKIKGLTVIHKCRVLYDQAIQSVAVQPYQCRVLSRFKMVHVNNLEYEYKSEDRKEIERLFSDRFPADEILIFKNGLLTDASIFNIVVDDGKKWLTPAKPLLQGVMRQSLLKQGIIHPTDITREDFLGMRRFRLINAMNPFEEAPDYSMDKIIS